MSASPRRSGVSLAHAALLALLAFPACGEPAAPRLPDGSLPVDALMPSDAGGDALAPLSYIDFTVSGCDALELPGPVCRARVPAQLRFVGIAPTVVDTWLWTLGDGTTATGATVEHRFEVPGSFDVVLTVSGPGGTARALRPGFVRVDAAPVGGACADEAQCAAGLECLCDADDLCPAPLVSGLCTRSCSALVPCDDGAVCADLDRSGADGLWRQALCLPACLADADCGAGLHCRELPSAVGWVRGCFTGWLVADEGAACAAADGSPDAAACASGACLALGTRGLCAGACATDADCPHYASCAVFSDPLLGARCLARCEGGRSCDTDPWLQCEAPDPTGAFGFTALLDEGYCAPRRCSADGDCGPDGACVGDGGAGFCGAVRP
ncbi:MAG: PKD domain-containing protein [Myxococcales bacterium]|nr:PKD domain-containing protein [Myxococcales bacterium]